MNKKIIWIGGPSGVGKSTLIKKALSGFAPIMHTGSVAIATEKRLSKDPRWKKLTQRQKLNWVNREIISSINDVLKQKDAIILDSHFSFRGKALVPKESLRKLASTPNVEFLMVHLTASRREILQRILQDTQRSRGDLIKQVREDILLNKRFYEEYNSFLNGKKTLRSITLWNKKVEETSELLKGFVGDFISEKWKNSFLVRVNKR
ncbi:MAG: AAA family ATPase [archaeon]